MSVYFIFALFVSVIVHGAASFNAVDEAFLLQDRSLSSYGGFALAADLCPAELSGTCPSSSGKCCPQNTVCKLVATAEGYVCCPSSDSCVPAVKAAPDCALDTWVLWKNAVSYFCCLPGQIGVKAGNKVGNCVASNVPVESTAAATMVTPASAHPSIGSTTTSLSASPTSSTTSSGSLSSTTSSISSSGGSTSSANAASTATASSTQAAGTTTAGIGTSSTGGAKTSNGSITASAATIPSILGVLGFLALALFS